MASWKCPVCGELLDRCERVFRCGNGHSFDISKQGYVNLLMSHSSSAKRHGDDAVMVRARQEFLEKGYYSCLRDGITELAEKYTSGAVTLLDAGCGEGWYTEGVKCALESAGREVRALGIDISRRALMQASKRQGLELAVASVNALPVMDGGCSLLLSVFAPTDEREFCRVLAPGGVLIKASPMERHLFGLKRAVYDRPYENPPAKYMPEGFELLERLDIRQSLHLASPGDIRALFMMTPYYYKTGRADQEKLERLTELDTELEFSVFAMKRK